jgi:malonyl CoA-acyl carrier protein transacylase
MEGDLGIIGRALEKGAEKGSREKRLKTVVFEGPQDELTRSKNAQPAILVTSVAFLRALEDDVGVPLASDAAYFLGHSSGEYSAAVAAGSISFADGVRLTRLHGLLTSAALSLPSINLSPSPFSPALQRAQMSALVLNPGHEHKEVLQVVEAISDSEAPVQVASYNSSLQVVLAGSMEGILRASEVLRERGVASRAADLPVAYVLIFVVPNKNKRLNLPSSQQCTLPLYIHAAGG